MNGILRTPALIFTRSNIIAQTTSKNTITILNFEGRV